MGCWVWGGERILHASDRKGKVTDQSDQEIGRWRIERANCSGERNKIDGHRYHKKIAPYWSRNSSTDTIAFTSIYINAHRLIWLTSLNSQLHAGVKALPSGQFKVIWWWSPHIGLHELACMPAIFSLLGLNATDHTKQPWATTGIFTGKNFWGQFLKLLAWVYQQK